MSSGIIENYFNKQINNSLYERRRLHWSFNRFAGLLHASNLWREWSACEHSTDWQCSFKHNRIQHLRFKPAIQHDHFLCIGNIRNFSRNSQPDGSKEGVRLELVTQCMGEAERLCTKDINKGHNSPVPLSKRYCERSEQIEF